MKKICVALSILLWGVTASLSRADQVVLQGLLPQELRGLAPDKLEAAKRFVLNNVRFVMFHETGHLLVSELDLPVVGREEDAVDTLSTLVLLNHPDPELSESVGPASVGWMFAGEDGAAAGALPPMWDVHSLDQQRGYNIICLMYGKDPNYLVYAHAFGLPDERLQGCAQEYAQAARSWDKLLRPYQTQVQNQSAFTVTYYKPEHWELDYYAKLAQSAGVLELIDKTVTDSFALAPGMRITARECGFVNAFWMPSQRELTLCYELMPWFAESFAKRNR
ncbi:MAG: DUF4344 domain-containing metallopeptidase [Hyphomicrobiales bacterium]